MPAVNAPPAAPPCGCSRRAASLVWLQSASSRPQRSNGFSSPLTGFCLSSSPSHSLSFGSTTSKGQSATHNT